MSIHRRLVLKRALGALGARSAALPFATGPAWAQNAAARRPGAGPVDLRALEFKVTRLSVLTDRVVRSQAQRALGVLAQRAERILNDSVSEVRRLMAEVAEALGALPNLAQRHQGLLGSYAEFLEQARNLDVKNRPALLQLAVRSDDLGGDVDKLADDLVKELGQPQARLLTTTASLQRLTQDTAVHFLLGHTGPEAKDQLDKVNNKRAQFTKLLAEVRSTPLKSAQTTGLLPLLENQWMLMDRALDAQSREASAMENVCTTSERTLEVLTQLYPAYESLLKGAG